MLINLLGYWLFGLPLGYALCFHFRHGIFGLWIGLSLALVVIACLVLWRWSRDARSLARQQFSAQGS
jgi:MATE family multidrug resistance protein